ncbi:MAG: hypothetical protein D6820_12310 [Lentisphaerae bacterium]|nr:MAG: hypothetical protein D6820_12310 [Lentisphaerota bacterium]
MIKTGGFLRMKKIAAIAEAAGITMAPHQTKPLGTIANLHLAASTPCMHTFQEYNIEDAALRETMFRNAPKLTNGFLQLPEDPGLGVEFTDAFKSALVRLP